MPNGRTMELSYRGLNARAAERNDGTWLLLTASKVGIDTAASATSGAWFQRAAWLYSALLEPAGDGSSYVVTRDLVFASGRAVSHFVTGSKSVGLSAGRSIDDDDDPDLPVPAP